MRSSSRDYTYPLALLSANVLGILVEVSKLVTRCVLVQKMLFLSLHVVKTLNKSQLSGRKHKSAECAWNCVQPCIRARSLCKLSASVEGAP